MPASFVGVPPKIHLQQGAGIIVISLEPALDYLREKIRTGKIMEDVIGQRAYNRLVEFGNND